VIDPHAGRRLLALSRKALRSFVERQETYHPVATDLPRALLQPTSTFVTLRRSGQLRGCIGSVHARLPIYRDVVRNTIAAAHDPRFEPVNAAELPDICIEISILSPFRPIRYVNRKDLLRQLRPSVDGIIVSQDEHRGLLLPQVWERLPQPQQFMQALCRKADIAWDAFDDMPPTVMVATFEVVHFAELEREATDDREHAADAPDHQP
jgi:AmmeMemoRadiSam system protein A